MFFHFVSTDIEITSNRCVWRIVDSHADEFNVCQWQIREFNSTVNYTGDSTLPNVITTSSCSARQKQEVCNCMDPRKTAFSVVILDSFVVAKSRFGQITEGSKPTTEVLVVFVLYTFITYQRRSLEKLLTLLSIHSCLIVICISQEKFRDGLQSKELIPAEFALIQDYAIILFRTE